jgi:predicted nucleotidyltransferase
MRLNESEVEIIKETLGAVFCSPKIYLFGSRAKKDGRGGDIDLFVIAQNVSYTQKIKALAKLKNRLHKPVDIVLHRDFDRAIEKEALKGIELT